MEREHGCCSHLAGRTPPTLRMWVTGNVFPALNPRAAQSCLLFLQAIWLLGAHPHVWAEGRCCTPSSELGWQRACCALLLLCTRGSCGHEPWSSFSVLSCFEAITWPLQATVRDTKPSAQERDDLAGNGGHRKKHRPGLKGPGTGLLAWAVKKRPCPQGCGAHPVHRQVNTGLCVR